MPSLASRYPGSQRPQSGSSTIDASLFFRLGLLVLLYNVIIDISYDPAGPSGNFGSLVQVVATGADGSASRQIIYFALFLCLTAAGVLSSGWKVLSCISVPYNLACFWCLISFLWAINPDISIRRSIGMYIILIAVCVSVQNLGPRKTLETVRLFLMAVITASLVSVCLSSIGLFSFAVHPAGESDATLIGAWRGVMAHKNVAGAVMTHASVIFLHFALNRRRPIDWLFFALSILFLVGTKSKTSIALDGLIISFGLAYRYFMLKSKGRSVFLYLIVVTMFSFGIFLWVHLDDVYAYLSNPSNLSGRVAIWESLVPFIENHVWLGSGYGSFWAIGNASPIYSLAIKEFVRAIGHSHSGYFEILISTGVIGLMLALVALVIHPAYQLIAGGHRNPRIYSLCCSLWFFGLLQNFTEAQFFSPDKQSWVFVVIALSIIRSLYHESRTSRPARAYGLAPRPLAAGSAPRMNGRPGLVPVPSLAPVPSRPMLGQPSR